VAYATTMTGLHPDLDEDVLANDAVAAVRIFVTVLRTRTWAHFLRWSAAASVASMSARRSMPTIHRWFTPRLRALR